MIRLCLTLATLALLAQEPATLACGTRVLTGECGQEFASEILEAAR